MAKGTISTATCWKTDDIERALGFANEVKPLWEKHGADSTRIALVHTGTRAGQLLFVLHFADWESYGKAQAAIAKDKSYNDILSKVQKMAELSDREISVGLA